MIMPLIELKLEINSCADDVNNELSVTTNAEKITDNPKTKNTVFRITLVLFKEIVCDSVDFVKSEIVIPEIYAKNAGMIGSIHGAKNELTPATIARKILTSAMY